VRNFSEKYNKGKCIGTGPFGQVFTCWLRDGQIEETNEDLMEPKKNLLS